MTCGTTDGSKQEKANGHTKYIFHSRKKADHHPIPEMVHFETGHGHL